MAWVRVVAVWWGVVSGVVVVGQVICVVAASASNWFLIFCLREYLMLLRLKRESLEDKRHQGHVGGNISPRFGVVFAR